MGQGSVHEGGVGRRELIVATDGCRLPCAAHIRGEIEGDRGRFLIKRSEGVSHDVDHTLACVLLHRVWDSV